MPGIQDPDNLVMFPTFSRRRSGPAQRGAGQTAASRAVQLSALLAAACSPVLDWRQVRPEGWGLAALMPCRPAQQQRQVVLAGKSAALSLWVCSTGGHTFALASVEVDEPARIGPVLQALAAAAQANVQGQVLEQRAASVSGMTPHPAALRLQLSGRMPDGRAVQEQVQVFSHGLRVFQAVALGSNLGPAQAAPFFDAIEIVK